MFDFEKLVEADKYLLLTLNGSESLYWDGCMTVYTTTMVWIPLAVVLLYVLIKNNNINCKIVVSEIEDNPILSKGKIGKHNIQGVGTNFIPSILDVDLIDRIILVSEKEVYDVANEFVEEEGILIGMSSALNLAAALKIAKIDENKKIVVIFPDNGNKYLSTSMYKKRT